MSGEIIRLENVRKEYAMVGETVHALDGVSFNIAAGEYVSIMGPSGSGKSTCMNIIGCLDRPTSGSVVINGKSTAELSEKELAALRSVTLGFVFQQYHLLASMTVLENVMLPLRYQGVEYSERKPRATAALEAVNLADRMHHLPSELSGGQKQRAAIARACVTRPGIVLADEPTGALDSESGRMVLNVFEEINKTGAAVIIVTHDSKVAENARRHISIFDGKIASDT
jgi:putative ABC transport system ATP-binding protein